MNDTPLFDQQAVTAIVTHMNDDHADALSLYLQAFTTIQADADTAVMTAIDAKGINVDCQIEGEQRDVRIEFSTTGAAEQLENRTDARNVLVEMVKLARAKHQE